MRGTAFEAADASGGSAPTEQGTVAVNLSLETVLSPFWIQKTNLSIIA